MHEICHVEFATTDLDATQTFLGGLFSWEFKEMMPGYVFFSPPEGPAGALEKVDEPKGAGALSMFIHVESVNAACEKVAGLGGGVVTPKTEIGGGHGFYAVLSDPGGSEIGIWQPAE